MRVTRSNGNTLKKKIDMKIAQPITTPLVVTKNDQKKKRSLKNKR